MSLQLVRFVRQGNEAGTPAAGLLAGGGVADLQRVARACDTVRSTCSCSDCWSSPLGIVTCEGCLEAARGYADWLAGLDAGALAELTEDRDRVRLLAPVENPGKVLCLAQNFPAHAAEASAHITQSGISRADSMTPHVFMKPTGNTLRGDGDPIVIGRGAQFVDYEAEAVLVIGQRGKYVRAADAASVIAAVTCMNDVSERRLKVWERSEERQWDHFFDWLNGKWMDSFAPLGPALVPAADLDLDNLRVRCRVNGELRQEDNTGAMYHLAGHVVEYVSNLVTLEPGDIIALGTPAGVGIARNEPLRPGDVVEVEVEGVGLLTNPVVAEEPAP